MVPLLVLTLLTAAPAGSSGTGSSHSTGDASAPGMSSQLPDHSRFSTVLRSVVRGSSVDYAALQRDRGGLDAYVQALGNTPESEVLSAPLPEQLAFWINAYNACMLRRVINHYPLLERARPGILGAIQNRLAGRPANSVWRIRNVFSGEACRVAGRERSLDEIEHSIIRPLGEARIHFAINCAARSCPPLIAEAYEGDRLEDQLEDRVRAFMADPAQFQMDTGSRTLRVNPILDWFGEDFGGPEGIRRFFAARLTGQQQAALQDPTATLEFSTYDWTLNDVP